MKEEQKYIVVFKKQPWEKVNSYSIVSESLLSGIDTDIILGKKVVENRLYSKEELEKLRNEVVQKT